MPSEGLVFLFKIALSICLENGEKFDTAAIDNYNRVVIHCSKHSYITNLKVKDISFE